MPSALAVSHPQVLETGRAQLSGGLRHTKHAWRIPEIRKVTEGYALPYDCKGLTERPLVSSNPVLLSKLTDSLARSSIEHLRVNSRCLYKGLAPLTLRTLARAGQSYGATLEMLLSLASRVPRTNATCTTSKLSTMTPLTSEQPPIKTTHPGIRRAQEMFFV